MRDTHSVMISRAVQSVEVGLNAGRSDGKSATPVSLAANSGSGQPIVDIGQRAEENQVSSTSESSTKPIDDNSLASPCHSGDSAACGLGQMEIVTSSPLRAHRM